MNLPLIGLLLLAAIGGAVAWSLRSRRRLPGHRASHLRVRLRPWAGPRDRLRAS
jgi:hypothetical protein